MLADLRIALREIDFRYKKFARVIRLFHFCGD